MHHKRSVPKIIAYESLFYCSVIIAILFCFFNVSYAQADMTVSGTVQSARGEHIPFASIIDINSTTVGTTSDEKGKFIITFSASDLGHKIQFSSVGYADTIISVKDLLIENLIIQLIDKSYYLEEFMISSSGNVTNNYLGLPGGTILQFENSDSGFPNSAGRASGVYVSPGKKDKGVINSVEIYITSEGFYDAPLSMRIMVPEMNMKENKLESTKKFRDLLRKPVVVKAEKPGWMTIDLSDYNVGIPNRNFIVMFTPLDYGEKYRWTSKFGKRYGAVIGTYEAKKVPNMKWAMQVNGKYCYDNSAKRDFVPAVAIHYSQQNE